MFLNDTVGGIYRNYCALYCGVTLGPQSTAVFTCSQGTVGTAVNIFSPFISAAITVNVCDVFVHVLVRNECSVKN